MRLDEIKLFNLRAFERFELELDPQLTLLVGRNGAGKSTVLDGIAVALGAWLGGFQSIKEDHSIRKSWARLQRTEFDGVAMAQPTYPVRVEARGEIAGVQDIEWARELRSVGGRTTSGEASGPRNLAAKMEQRLDREDTQLPLLAYYGTGRLWIHKRERTPSERSRLAGYRAALEAASDHKGFEMWMARLEKDRIQRLARAHEEGRSLADVRTPLLDAVSQTACTCLEGAIRFYYSANHEELRVDFADGSSIPFTSLSDGQRTIVAVAADLAWRATQLNPHLGRRAPARTRGVVLIDEVELHLHPAWQRRVLGDLLAAFPRLQFIATTHSPQVMSSAPAGAIRMLAQGQPPARISARGKTTNVILEDLMGVSARPDHVCKELLELGRSIEDGHLSEARIRLQRLSEGEPGPDDPSIVAATWELEMAERAAGDSGQGDAADPEEA